MYALPGLVDFAKQHKLHVQITTVSGYPYLTLDSVPEQDLIAFKSWAEQNTKINQAQRSLIVNLTSTAKFDATLSQKFKEYINLLDGIRGTDYFSVFPEAR